MKTTGQNVGKLYPTRRDGMLSGFISLGLLGRITIVASRKEDSRIDLAADLPELLIIPKWMRPRAPQGDYTPPPSDYSGAGDDDIPF